MGPKECIFFIVILFYGYKTYQKQAYPLDRLIARLIKRFKSSFRL